MTASGVLKGVAIGLDAVGEAADKPIERAVAKVAADVVRAIAALMVDRSPEECLAILEALRDHGTKAISASELDAQTQAVIDRAKHA